MTLKNPVLTAQIKLAFAVAASIQEYGNELKLLVDTKTASDSTSDEMAQLVLDSDHRFNNVRLVELLETLPISRSSLFELVRSLGIATTKGPDSDGKGRVAWVSREQADRIRSAAHDVAAGRAQIADFDQRHPGRISKGKLLRVISELLPMYALHREVYRVSEFRRYCEPDLNSLLGKVDMEKDRDNRPKWHSRFDCAHKETASRLGFSVTSNGVYRTA